MKKICLTESQLNKIIGGCVKRIIKESGLSYDTSGLSGLDYKNMDDELLDEFFNTDIIPDDVKRVVSSLAGRRGCELYGEEGYNVSDNGVNIGYGKGFTIIANDDTNVEELISKMVSLDFAITNKDGGRMEFIYKPTFKREEEFYNEEEPEEGEDWSDVELFPDRD